MKEQFLQDVKIGLSTEPKFISSKYFYDQTGDLLFVEIMNLPEYYLTRSELEIFEHQTLDLILGLSLEQNTFFELIELGAGDGTKTKHLLQSLVDHKFKFNYQPIDISSHALEQLSHSLKTEIPSLKVIQQHGDYFNRLADLKQSKHPKVILFLGSNIGNMSDNEAHGFLSKLSDSLNINDKVLLGVDLIKANDIVLPAYNDAQNVTARFNLNLLARINAELAANFNIEQFEHAPEYCEKEGIAKSFLVSKHEQVVTVNEGHHTHTFHFKEGEKIHTEISRKYNDQIVSELLKNTGLEISTYFSDSKNYFRNYVLNKKESF